jgi:hypothetical protein
MKTPSKSIKQAGLTVLASLLIVSLAIPMLPANTVQASDTISSTRPFEESTPPPTGDQAWGTGMLEKALKREQKFNENLTGILEKADKAVTRLEGAIDTGKEEKRDVSALENALVELTGQIGAARIAHDQAASLLAHPAGFDKAGAVTDRQLALETVREIHQIQQNARQQICDSIKDAINAMRDYRQDNPAE